MIYVRLHLDRLYEAPEIRTISLEQLGTESSILEVKKAVFHMEEIAPFKQQIFFLGKLPFNVYLSAHTTCQQQFAHCCQLYECTL